MHGLTSDSQTWTLTCCTFLCNTRCNTQCDNQNLQPQTRSCSGCKTQCEKKNMQPHKGCIVLHSVAYGSTICSRQLNNMQPQTYAKDLANSKQQGNKGRGAQERRELPVATFLSLASCLSLPVSRFLSFASCLSFPVSRFLSLASCLSLPVFRFLSFASCLSLPISPLPD